MATKPPLRPQRQRPHYLTRHFRHCRSLADALLDHFREFPWLYHRCVPHTHHRQQQRFRRVSAMMTSLWRGLCSRLHRPPGCPKPHQCVNEASGMRGAAAGVVLMGKIASICHQRRPFLSMAASRTPRARAAYRSLQYLVLLRGTTTIHNRCLVWEGGEWCLFCGSNEGQHWGEHLHFDLRVDGNVLPNNSPLHSILSTQI